MQTEPGSTYGRLTVLQRVLPDAARHSKRWLCRCECGRETVVLQRSLRAGYTKSCGTGCYQKLSIGSHLGRWTVTASARPNKHKQTQWVCRCRCGTITTVSQQSLKSGQSKSCGCISREKINGNEYRKTHGERTPGKVTKEYRTWQSMKSRCYSKNHKDYKYWGARGITVYEPWRNSYENFLTYLLATIGRRPGSDYSLDRENNDGNYEPGNIRWATRSEQQRNKRKPNYPKNRKSRKRK